MRTVRLALAGIACLAASGCVGQDGLIRLPSLMLPTATASGEAQKPHPAVCSEIDKINYSAGKPGVTVADVQAALSLPPSANPLGKARNLLGDTVVTISAAQDANAVIDRLCPPAKAGPTP